MSLATAAAQQRADYVDLFRAPQHRRWMQLMDRSARVKGDEFLPRAWSFQQSMDSIERAARMAEVFTATPEMMDLVEHAAASLPPQTIDTFDLPSTEGWLHLPRPFVNTDVRGDLMKITDIMWAERPCVDAKGKPKGVWFWQFTSMGRRDDPLRRQVSAQTYAEIAAKIPKASLLAMHQLPHGGMGFQSIGMDGTRHGPDEMRDMLGQGENTFPVLGAENGEYVVAVPPDGALVTLRADPFMQFMKSYWHFVGSELAEVERDPLPRTMRRWFARLQMPETPVSVVRLRRRKQSAEHGSTWHLTYRYVRRGHWRAQWYGSGTNRYQRHIWIAPTIVGPEDGPLRVRDVVNLLSR